MEKLLNFNEPIDVPLLDNVVEALYGTNPQNVCYFVFLSSLFNLYTLNSVITWVINLDIKG